MFPYLFEWFVDGTTIRPRTYGLFLALAFSVSYFDALRRTRRMGENPKHIESLFLIVVVSSIVGARLFHVLFEDFSYYRQNPGQILAIWNGGYTLYGALLLGLLSSYFYAQIKKFSFLQYADICAPSVALGIGIGRIGCFFAGCCWGTPTDVPWAVTFSHPESFTAIKGVPVHAAQLYEALGGFALYGFIRWRAFRRIYRGQAIFELLLGYSLVRFAVEFFRGDNYRGFLIENSLSYPQFVSLVIIPFVIISMFLYSRGPKKTES